jgi:pyridoxal phosphate enzyme (YggS family)
MSDAGLDALRERVAGVRARVREACRLSGRPEDAVAVMAVTKGHPREAVVALMALGFTLFGENRVQEAHDKYAGLDPGRTTISLHLIGHLQTNKVKLALSSFQVIQSLDSLKLAAALARHAGEHPVDVMVEVNMGREPQKHGILPETARAFVEALGTWPALRVVGLMAMLPAWPVDKPLEALMEEARRLWEAIRQDAWPWAPLGHLSMGMSGDFEAAIRHGSTMVRLGTALLGQRSEPLAKE